MVTVVKEGYHEMHFATFGCANGNQYTFHYKQTKLSFVNIKGASGKICENYGKKSSFFKLKWLWAPLTHLKLKHMIFI